ncbi:MAG: MBL fold metallo-hydrolase [bacterium]|nr:MAG: MBL fold metallo-hydrolase [bacterium]
MKNDIQYMMLGDSDRIGASCHYLRLGEWGLLLDAGIDPHQGNSTVPPYEKLKGMPVNAIMISHAHLDHLGSLPVAIRHFPHARVYMTPATAALSEVLLFHYLKVQERRAKLARIQFEPLYTPEELENYLYLFQSFEYNFPFNIHGFQESKIDLTFWDAGHILGSAGIEIKWRGKHIFYTGNTKKSKQFILKGAKYPRRTHILITETTYGSNELAPQLRKQNDINRLAEYVIQKIKYNGAILIPVFALGRTQEIMYLLHRLISQGKVPAVPIYVIGMGIKINKIYDRLLHKIYPDFQPKFFKTITADTLFRKQYRKPSIILATSGMMLPNTLSYEIASDFLSDARNGIAIVGWADPETPGGSVRNMNTEKIKAIFGIETVQCDIKVFYFSAHSHREELLEMIEDIHPHNTVLCHGDSEALRWMKAQVENRQLSSRVIIPKPAEILTF